MPQRADRNVVSRHRDHHFQTGQGVAGGVGVDGRHRSFVAGVHRLEHVQRFARTHFADDDPIRTHTQTVLHQIALSHFAAAFDVRRPRFQANDVRLLELQFRRVFDRDHALVRRGCSAKGSSAVSFYLNPCRR